MPRPSLDIQPLPAPDAGPATALVRAGDWALLALLTLLSVLNFLDRQLLAALAPRLVRELHLTNTQLGLLIGFAFVLFFAFATLLVGALADRWPRPRLIAGGVALWSAMTAFTGAAHGFGELALARVFIGLGEAALVPCALSLLADRFPPSRLGLACGVFWAGLPIGRALSYFVAGVVAPEVGWRACFYALGVAGIPCAAVVLLFRERRPRRVPPPEGGSTTIGDAARSFAALPALRWVVAGNALASVAASASQLDVAWLASERGFSPERAALASGIVVTFAGLLGNPLIGALGDRWEGRRSGGRLRCLAVVMAVATPLAAGFYLLPSGSVPFYACWFAAQLALASWPGASSAVIQELAPARTRALVVAVAMVVVNLFGIGPGAWLAGAVGDARSLTAGLLAATAIACLAVVPYLLSARRYPADRGRGERLA